MAAGRPRDRGAGACAASRRSRGDLRLHDFRFVRAAAALGALRRSFEATTVRREPVRPRRHPIGLYARLTARAA
ncbi:hypothetical protein [Nocardia abscessus]|uniref:hypothetical protein n=1 Tax=Nocardia abscessus TaxID=120957 RepID=UPI002454F826|nr:hypothetical protein [Nocardia abscessus]